MQSNHCAIIAIFCWLSLFTSSVQAGLLLHPTRLIFNEGQSDQVIQIDVANTGSEKEIYRIHLINKRMDEQGQLIDIAQPANNELSAHELIYFTPRQITLLPYDVQTIRVGVHKPQNLMEGEYRSHLLFERIANSDGQSSINSFLKQQRQKSQSEVNIVVKALVSATIPIFVHHGTADIQAEINDLTILANKDLPRVLTLKLTRRGNRSIYGTLFVQFIAKTGRTTHLESKPGIAVYSPTPYRIVQINLPNQKLANGKLRVSYLADDNSLLAQSELPLFNEN